MFQVQVLFIIVSGRTFPLRNFCSVAGLIIKCLAYSLGMNYYRDEESLNFDRPCFFSTFQLQFIFLMFALYRKFCEALFRFCANVFMLDSLSCFLVTSYERHCYTCKNKCLVIGS